MLIAGPLYLPAAGAAGPALRPAGTQGIPGAGRAIIGAMAGLRGMTALVTGASGGIGLELARLMAREGWDLVLASRDGAALARIAGELSAAHGITAIPVAVDLATPAGPEALHRAVVEKGVSVDVLVNNAGFGAHGPFALSDPETMAGMVELNVASLVRLTRLFVGPMAERRRGRILNVSSIAGFVPGPYMAVYHATKAFVTSFSEALAEELRGTGVTVTALCPGPVRTGFAARAGTKEMPAQRFMQVTATACVRAGYRGMMKGKRMVIPGLANRFLIAASRLLPRRIVAHAVGIMQKGR